MKMIENGEKIAISMVFCAKVMAISNDTRAFNMTATTTAFKNLWKAMESRELVPSLNMWMQQSIEKREPNKKKICTETITYSHSEQCNHWLSEWNTHAHGDDVHCSIQNESEVKCTIFFCCSGCWKWVLVPATLLLLVFIYLFQKQFRSDKMLDMFTLATAKEWRRECVVQN